MTSLIPTSRHAGGRPEAGPPIARTVVRLQGVLAVDHPSPQVLAGGMAAGGPEVEVPAGHLAMVSHPDDVAQLIETAAEAVQTAH
jgi:hypothetical protein